MVNENENTAVPTQADLFDGLFPEGGVEAQPVKEKSDRKPVLNEIEKIVAKHAQETGKKITPELAQECLVEIARGVFDRRVNVGKVECWLTYDRKYLAARLARAEAETNPA